MAWLGQVAGVIPMGILFDCVHVVVNLLGHRLARSARDSFGCAGIADVVIAPPALVPLTLPVGIHHYHGVTVGAGVGIGLEILRKPARRSRGCSVVEFEITQPTGEIVSDD